jgi:hypothetical protein
LSFPYVCPEPVLAKCSFLYINGSKMPFFFAGNLTAVGYSLAGAITARHTVETTSAAGGVALVISVDVPSLATGTGEALVLDGQDTGANTPVLASIPYET